MLVPETEISLCVDGLLGLLRVCKIRKIEKNEYSTMTYEKMTYMDLKDSGCVEASKMIPGLCFIFRD